MNITSSVGNLRTNYLTDPVGMEKESIRFSWRMYSELDNIYQTHYRITVIKNYPCGSVIWDSGKVLSDKSLNIRYGGNPLEQKTEYYWNVTVWNNKDEILETKQPAFFETSPDLLEWKNVNWIKYPFTYETEKNTPVMFRKQFSLTGEVRKARLYSSALGIYDVYINGKRAGNDELKPGWTDYNRTVLYFSYDITDLLLPHKNAVCAEVTSGWFSGSISYKAKYNDGTSAFIAQICIEYNDGTCESILTDTSWESSKSKAVKYADIYHGEVYDSSEDNISTCSYPDYNTAGWISPSLSDSFKGTVKPHTGPSVQIRDHLEQKPSTIIKYRGLKDNGSDFGEIDNVTVYNKPTSVFINEEETLIYDFGQNMVGREKITVVGLKGTVVNIRFSEMLNDSGERSRSNDGPQGSLYTENYRSAKSQGQYILKGDFNGETYSPSYTFYGFRYMEITVKGKANITSVSAQAIGSATEEGSNLETSNEPVNKLYRNVLWSQRGNFLSIPTDCPQRDERLGWTGDTQIFARTASYNADVAGFFHKWMGDMRDSQRSDGAYPDVAPHNDVVGFGKTAWADAGITVPWTMYLMYNDIDIIKENYESMEKYMAFLETQKDDTYLYNGAAGGYGDWVAYEETDSRYISVCYYSYTAKLMSKMSAALSRSADDIYSLNAEKYYTLHKNIKEEFNARYTDSNGNLDQTTQTAYLLALRFELYKDDNIKEIWKNKLLSKIKNNSYKLSTGFVGTGILNQTLSQIGASDMAYTLLLQRDNPSWLYSVDQGSTTIWERWNSYTKAAGLHPDGMNSFNHYAYGVIAEWMYRYMAGIEPDEKNPGFKHIILQPKFDLRKTPVKGQKNITWVKAEYNSYYGSIKSEWKVHSSNHITYKAAVPANTTATLYLPSSSDDKDISVYELTSGIHQFNITDNGIT